MAMKENVVILRRVEIYTDDPNEKKQRLFRLYSKVLGHYHLAFVKDSKAGRRIRKLNT